MPAGKGNLWCFYMPALMRSNGSRTETQKKSDRSGTPMYNAGGGRLLAVLQQSRPLRIKSRFAWFSVCKLKMRLGCGCGGLEQEGVPWALPGRRRGRLARMS